MRKTASLVLTLTGALIALVVSFSPSVALASATYTTDGIAPFVNGITLRSGGEIISAGAKTNQDVLVVLSIDPGSGGGGVAYSAGFENYRFTENGVFVFEFSNSLGATGSSTVTIDNIDRTPPVITIDSYSTTPTTNDVEVTATTNEGTLNTGTHTYIDNGSFDFVATDEAGNISTSTVSISHIDRTAPTLTLLGSSALQFRTGTPFVDEGATATDNMSTTVSMVTTGTVDTNTVGTYTLTYSATDEAGNEATPITRTVEVTRRSSSGGGGGSTTTNTGTLSSIGRVLGASTYNFTKDMALGDKGEDITALQTALYAAGYFDEVPTGYFGPKTEAAVKLYQAAKGIRQSGVCGPLTRAALSNGTVSSAPMTVEAQIASLLAQLLVLKQKLASLTL